MDITGINENSLIICLFETFHFKTGTTVS
jgi:hypothetical protein